MQLPLALRKNQAMLIQASRKRFQVQEFEHLQLVLGLDKRKDSTLDVCRQVVLVTNDIRDKGIALHHFIAHVLEINDIHTLVQASNRARDTVLVLLVAILLVQNDIAGIDAPEMVGNAIAQVVPRYTYRNRFNRIASHHRNEPFQRFAEIRTEQRPEITHQHIRYKNHHIVQGDTDEINFLFTIKQAHHGHKRVGNINTHLGRTHEREDSHKANQPPKHSPQAKREVAVQDFLTKRKNNEGQAHQYTRRIRDVTVTQETVKRDGRARKGAEEQNFGHRLVHRTSIL